MMLFENAVSVPIKDPLWWWMWMLVNGARKISYSMRMLSVWMVVGYNRLLEMKYRAVDGCMLLIIEWVDSNFRLAKQDSTS